jgi:LPXTG-site transpeptidase (sortase) family protein
VRHRTDNKRIGLAVRGMCSLMVAAMATLLLWEPEAASESRADDFANARHTHEPSSAYEELDLSTRKGLWANPRGINIPVGRIRIPAIDLDTEFRSGIHDDVVKLGPGLWPGTPLPGNAGNAVFAGHRTTHTHPFAGLDLLHKGNVITTQIHGYKRTFFRVIRTTVVPESKYARFVLKQPARKRVRTITLFACTPKGFRTHRIVVQARASRLPREVKHRLASRVDKSRSRERS